eukprot:359108-Chlamydomonas_euryale.AAC.13
METAYEGAVVSGVAAWAVGEGGGVMRTGRRRCGHAHILVASAKSLWHGIVRACGWGGVAAKCGFKLWQHGGSMEVWLGNVAAMLPRRASVTSVYGSMAAWRCGDVRVWQHGGMEVWHQREAAWRCGDVRVWQHGGMEVWHQREAAWRCGDVRMWQHGCSAVRRQSAALLQDQSVTAWRRSAELTLLSCTPGSSTPGGMTTAAATTGPANGPRPASSTPQTCSYPSARSASSISRVGTSLLRAGAAATVAEPLAKAGFPTASSAAAAAKAAAAAPSATARRRDSRSGAVASAAGASPATHASWLATPPSPAVVRAPAHAPGTAHAKCENGCLLSFPASVQASASVL